jgi:hypothetical protein
MRQIVKRVKGGQEIKFTCSICGETIYDMFVLDGDTCEINWEKIPEKCSCGEKLTNRQPIIDNSDTGVDNVSSTIRENVHGNTCNNVHRYMQRVISKDISGNPDVYRRCMIDLGNAVSIDYFDMRLGGLKIGNCKIPDNIDHLRTECIKRNISYVESCMERSSYDEDCCDKDELKEKLKILRQIYSDISKNSDISKKSEDKKDFEKKKRF